jgi:hypothetical protein
MRGGCAARLLLCANDQAKVRSGGLLNVLWVDKYERQARLVPGLLALLPVAITVAALGYVREPVISAVVSLLSLAGGPVVLADTVRRMGLKAQRQLWSTWGGSPTTIVLRLREANSNTIQRDRWRDAVQKITGIRLASARSEASNPAGADQAIETAVSQIREMTRGKDQFYMVQAENIAYGRQRNFYGTRIVGRLVAFLSLLVVIGFILWPLLDGKHPDLRVTYIIGLLLDSFIMLGWYFLPSSGQVREAGDRYANQLLQASVTLAAEAPHGAMQPPP